MSYTGITMDFINVRELRLKPGAVWQRLVEEGELVLTRNGKPFAILSRTSPSGLEQDLQALRAARFGRALDAVRRTAAETGADRLTDEDIAAVIREAREERARCPC
jgi:hypothetical protein